MFAAMDGNIVIVILFYKWNIQKTNKINSKLYFPFLGTLSIDTTKKKWKSLVDSFRAYSKKNRQAASGSAATSGKKPWVHFERMQFLRDVQLESRYAYNNNNLLFLLLYICM